MNLIDRNISLITVASATQEANLHVTYTVHTHNQQADNRALQESITVIMQTHSVLPSEHDVHVSSEPLVALFTVEHSPRLRA